MQNPPIHRPESSPDEMFSILSKPSSSADHVCRLIHLRSSTTNLSWKDNIDVVILCSNSLVIRLFALVLGDYIMIAGKFLGTNGSTQVLVDAYRIQSLTSTRTHEGRWPFEVVDISQRVYHFISS